jgi:hypothetical protein
VTTPHSLKRRATRYWQNGLRDQAVAYLRAARLVEMMMRWRRRDKWRQLELRFTT